MSVMIKLKASELTNDFDKAKNLPGLANVELDSDYGLLKISPEVCIVRTEFIDNVDMRKELSPEILDVYPDLLIGPFNNPFTAL